VSEIILRVEIDPHDPNRALVHVNRRLTTLRDSSGIRLPATPIEVHRVQESHGNTAGRFVGRLNAIGGLTRVHLRPEMFDVSKAVLFDWEGLAPQIAEAVSRAFREPAIWSISDHQA
jgi:hypothetical protein